MQEIAKNSVNRQIAEGYKPPKTFYVLSHPYCRQLAGNEWKGEKNAGYLRWGSWVLGIEGHRTSAPATPVVIPAADSLSSARIRGN